MIQPLHIILIMIVMPVIVHVLAGISRTVPAAMELNHGAAGLSVVVDGAHGMLMETEINGFAKTAVEMYILGRVARKIAAVMIQEKLSADGDIQDV